MFDYAPERHKLLISLGQFLSRHVHRQIKAGNTKNSILEADFQQLAKDYLDDVYPTYIAQIASYPDKDWFLEEVAEYFKERIPFTYKKWNEGRDDSSPSRLARESSL